jgi:RNA polymerase sigma factor (sigma-70 family)
MNLEQTTVESAMFPAVLDVPAAARRERPTRSGPIGKWPDEHLVAACLEGDQRAWAMLIARYKNLIYSFPRNYGADRDDAADVFQLVCADLFIELPKLRRHGSVRSWIGTVAAHHAYRWKRRHLARVRVERGEADDQLDRAAVMPSVMLERAGREQAVRDAIEQLPRRCREVVRMLFFEEPPVPYHMVADRLGMTPGSVRWMRARSLKKLETILERSGVAE